MLENIIISLKEGNEKAYQELFYLYYPRLVSYSNTILKKIDVAEDLVQDFFINFWYQKKFLKIDSDLEGYLFQSIKNNSLNYIRDQKRKENKLIDYVIEDREEFKFALEEMEEKELIYKAIDKLPEQCKKILNMCCMEGMKYQDVADKLGISINTVRTQMMRAFKALRGSLSSETFTMILIISLLKYPPTSYTQKYFS